MTDPYRQFRHIRPVGDHVLIHVLPEDTTPGGIIIPEGVKVRNRAVVLATNPGHLEHGVHVPARAQKGDTVRLRSDVQGQLLEKLPNDGGQIVIIPEHYIVAVEQYDAPDRVEL
jgi:co-chaperonin GroES (HSP10)